MNAPVFSVKKTKDLDTLRTHFETLLTTGQTEEFLNQVMALLGQLTEDNVLLQHRVAKLLMQRYGSKSERLEESQAQLLLQLLQSYPQEPAEPAAMPSTDSEHKDSPNNTERPKKDSNPEDPPKRGHGRRPWPDLEVQEIEVPVSEANRVCKEHATVLECAGSLKQSRLEWTAGHFKILLYKKQRMRCPQCPEHSSVVASSDHLVEEGLPGPRLLTEVICKKYLDHCPLERQVQVFARDGVELAPSTLCGWVGKAADLYEALYKRLRHYAFASHVLSVDDTPLWILAEDHEKGRKRGFLWAMCGDEKWAYFAHALNHTADSCQKLLQDRCGLLQGDGYVGYRTLTQDSTGTAGVRLVACWVHTRRKYKEAADAKDGRALHALKWIRQLYELEAQWNREQLSPEQRQVQRKAQSEPIVKELEKWMAHMQPQVSAKSLLSKAIAYTRSRWKELQVFLEDGQVRLDTNHVEQQLRAVAVGRKNWLFAGAESGAYRAAVMYTLLANCKLQGISPSDWLYDVTTKLYGDWPASRLDELLPQFWKQPT